ncbi:hypothetical protein ACSBQ5_13595 [Staphylococcus equorum]|uniref:hypothetical protein n=1 Tax=Staphylococcus equorum TaxID=246432 RepID=UPI000D1C9A18|nr:hypothetical protein [Staphylococcus equorum]PTE89834.1 hypothetical protein BUY89_13905 [Staphylococcus equorum]
MKFFAGFITAVVIIALVLTGIYAYKELKPINEEQPQQTEEVEDTDTTQQMNQQTETQKQTQQEQPQQNDKAWSDLVKDQEQKKVEYLKKKASEGASADELHSLEVQLEQYRTNNADVLYGSE